MITDGDVLKKVKSDICIARSLSSVHFSSKDMEYLGIYSNWFEYNLILSTKMTTQRLVIAKLLDSTISSPRR